MAFVIEKGIEIADVYATALLELAQKAGQTDEILAELDELLRLTEADPNFTAFLYSATIDADARARSLERLFRGRLSDILLDTLQVMNQHGRVGLIRQLRRAYVLRLEQARGQIEVTAISAVELDPQQRKAVAEVAEEISGRTALVEYVIDPEIIGGLVLQIGDYRLDNSIRRQLSLVRGQLLERSRRGVDGGLVETSPGAGSSTSP